MRDAQHDATEQQAATVLVEVAGPVAHLTLNRPRQRNPLDRVTVAALREAIIRLEDDRSVQVVRLAGAGGTCGSSRSPGRRPQERASTKTGDVQARSCCVRRIEGSLQEGGRSAGASRLQVQVLQRQVGFSSTRA